MTDPSPAAPRPSRGWGGRRPGAGARKGNLNALKHGAYSRQFGRLGAMLANSPSARQVLLGLLERQQARGRRADELAAYIFSQIVARGLKRGRDRLILLPPVDDADSIKKNAAAPVRKGQKKNFSPPGPSSSRFQKRGSIKK